MQVLQVFLLALSDPRAVSAGPCSASTRSPRPPGRGLAGGLGVSLTSDELHKAGAHGTILRTRAWKGRN